MPDVSITLDQVRNLRVASPCPMQWEDLDGDGVTRHCHKCDLDVHDVSQMTAAEVAELIETANGRVCGRIYPRADGTVLTADCPVGVRALRAKARRTVLRVAALAGVALTAAVSFASRAEPGDSDDLRTLAPFARSKAAVNPAPPVIPMVMGEICVAPAPTSQGG